MKTNKYLRTAGYERRTSPQLVKIDKVDGTQSLSLVCVFLSAQRRL